MIMSRKNAFLFALLLSTSNTHTYNLFNFKQDTIAAYEVAASVILASIGTRLGWEIYDTKNDVYKNWKDTFKDPAVRTEITCAVITCVLSGLVFNDACKRLGIRY